MAARTAQPTFAELFTPKLVTVLREGYGLADFRADAIAGLTVAIVALPLSMAIAMASGVTPDRGLYASIVGGFLVSALGGSRFQIGGPAGAFIVLVSATVAAHGIDGLILATLLSGIIIAAIGLLQARHLHQIHPVSGDRRLHRGHRRHHLRQPDQGAARPADSTTSRDRSSPSSRRSCRRCRRRTSRRLRSRRSTIGTILAVRRYRPHWPAFIIAVAARGDRRGDLRPAGRDHRHALRRHPAVAAAAACAGAFAGRRSSRCCRRRCPLRCSAASKACCRRWSPTR